MRWLMAALIIFLGVSVGEATGQGTPPFTHLSNWLSKGPAPTPRGQSEDPQRHVEVLIELAWLGDPITFPYFLEARADKANLEVRGYVPSRAVREQALKIASLHSPLTIVDKVREHPSLTVKLTRLPARQMQTSAQSALRQMLPQLHQALEVEAGQDGMVTIRGAVKTHEEKLAVSQALRRLHGCLAVSNLLEVGSNGKQPTARIPARPPAKTGAANTGPIIPASKMDGPMPKARSIEQAKPGPVKPPIEAKKVAASTTAGDSDLPARIKKQIQQSCPGVTDIQVQIQSKQKIRISVHLQNEKELDTVAGRIFAITDLQSYEIDLQIMATQK